MKKNGIDGKNNKLLIIFLIVVIIGLVFFIVYDKFFTSNNNNNNNNINNNEEIDSKLVEKLENVLISKDLSFSLYGNNIATESHNLNIIKYGISNYVADNSINYSDKRCGTKIDNKTTYYINKSDINNYLNKKFNLNIKYDLKNTTILDDANNYKETYVLASLDDKWGIVCVAKGGGDTYYSNKNIKAVKENNKIILYDNMVMCTSDNGFLGCTDEVESIDNNYSIPFADYKYNCSDEDDCYSCSDEDNCINELFDKNSKIALEKIENINIYKSVFEKIGSEYYWVSTEKVDKID